MRRVLICGDRDWWDVKAIEGVLWELHHFDVGVEIVIEGEARGADYQGRMAAEKLGIPVQQFPAEWDKYGKGAGPKRNREMVDDGKPDLVIAFHDRINESKGNQRHVESCHGAPHRISALPTRESAGNWRGVDRRK